jgi:hypothetical protein
LPAGSASIFRNWANCSILWNSIQKLPHLTGSKCFPCPAWLNFNRIVYQETHYIHSHGAATQHSRTAEAKKTGGSTTTNEALHNPFGLNNPVIKEEDRS